MRWSFVVRLDVVLGSCNRAQPWKSFGEGNGKIGYVNCRGVKSGHQRNSDVARKNGTKNKLKLSASNEKKTIYKRFNCVFKFSDLNRAAGKRVRAPLFKVDSILFFF